VLNNRQMERNGSLSDVIARGVTREKARGLCIPPEIRFYVSREGVYFYAHAMSQLGRSRACTNMNAPKQQRVDSPPYVEAYPVPWDIMYFALALNCKPSIINAYAKAVYSKTHRHQWNFATNECYDVVEYRKFGIPHRTEGPAVVYSNGSHEYHSYGVPHRIGGPARIYVNERVDWINMGQLHRSDGPAVQYTDGTEFWWFNGTYYGEKCSEWLKIFGNKNL
jgi:hypothetical protein